MTLKNTPYRISALARVITYKMYVEHVNDNTLARFSVSDVSKLFTIPISKNLVKSALELSRSDHRTKFILRWTSKSEDQHLYSVSSDGIQFVERELRRKDSDLFYFQRYGDDKLADVAGLDGIFWTAGERLDAEAYAPLDIDRDDPQFIETLQAVDEAIERIRTDNAFAATSPEQREGILRTLENGIDWLRNKTTTRKLIVDNILSPLRWVVSHFGQSDVGAAAKAAIDTVAHWLSGF